MKSLIVFGVGGITGAIITTVVLSLGSASADNNAASTAEMAALKDKLARAELVAQRDRDALRAVQQEHRTSLAASPIATTTPVSMSPAPIERPGNAVIASYLGDPVAAPPNLDRKYSPTEMAAVFKDLVETLGIKVDQLAVDSSEFPFVIHGRINSSERANFFKKIDSELRALPGYTYGGSVTGGTKDGSTYFALNITPSSAYPAGQAEAIQRRLMLRLQMTAAAWSGSPP